MMGGSSVESTVSVHLEGRPMCWSGEASGVLATVGVTATVMLARKKEPKQLWIPLGYFSAMELCRRSPMSGSTCAATPPTPSYQPRPPARRLSAPLANIAAMYFVPDPHTHTHTHTHTPRIEHHIRKYVYALCAVAAAAILLKAFSLPAAGTCRFGVEGFCGPMACSVSGSWHIAWQWPLNGLMSGPIPWLLGFNFGLHAFAYYMSVFALPVLYGSWKFAGFHYLVGPLLASWTTDDPNELVAVWCLLSIGLCLS